MSNNILNNISSVYMQEVLKPQLGGKSEDGGKKVEKGGTSEEASAKRVRQAVYDIRYRARREGIELAQAFSQYTGKSSMTGQEKTAVKEKLGLAEEVEAIQEAEGQKFQVRVRDKESGKTYVRYATREKIAQLRANPNISSVEMTKYGKPYEGEKERGEYTSKVKAGKGLDPVGREDKDIDNDGDHDKTDKYLLNRRKVRGKAIATRKEEVESVEEAKGANSKTVEVPDKGLKSLVSAAAKRIDADNDGDVDKDDPKEKGMGEFVPTPDGKKKLGTKVKTEGFYSWRDSLVEVADEMDAKREKIKEKKIKNKIKINPSLGESIEKMGGELIESEEFSGVFDDIIDVDFYHISEELIENVLIEFYEEILEEGYDLLEVRKAIVESINIEMALLDEATVTYGHDTDTKGLKKTKMDSMKSAVKKAYTKGKQAYDSPTGKRVRKKVKRGLYRIAKRVSNVADRAAQRLMDVGEAVSQMPGRETNPPKGTTGKQDDVQRKQMLAAREKVMKKQQMLDRQRLQMQKALPVGHAEEVEYDIEEGMTMKDFKKKRSRQKQKEKRADEKTSPLRRAGIHADKASPERAARHRANVDPDYDRDDEEQMYPGGKLRPNKVRKAKALGELGEKLIYEDEYRRMLAKERQAERESEKEFRTKGGIGDKKKGPKLSSTKKSSVAGKDYADSQMGSIKVHDKASKGKHTIGSPFSEEIEEIEEKALSKAQQRFMGMVYATKKGDMPAPSAAVAKAAASMTGKEAKDFAKTKHKGLPEKKVAKEEIELDERTRYAKETGKDPQTGKESKKGGSLGGDDTHSKVMRHMKTQMRKSGGLMSSRGKAIKPQGQKKEPGKKPPVAGQYGAPKSPAQKVAARRAAAKRAQDNMSSRFD
jgi:hypothetical protein